MADPPQHDNFDLGFTRLPDGYQAQVLRSPVGRSSAVAFARPQIDPGTDPELSGRRLFQAIFTGPVGECHRQTLAMAHDQGARLRIRLRFSGCPELADLPWEFLYDEEENGFLNLSADTSVFRYAEMPTQPRAVPVSAFRVLVAMSHPVVPSALNLVDLTIAGLLTVTGLELPTLAELRDALAHDTFHVVHYLGSSRNAGRLLFKDDAGRPSWHPADELGLILREHPSLRLVLLSADAVPPGDALGSLSAAAGSLTRNGVAAVITRPFKTPDIAGMEFTPAFYGALVAGQPVDAALAEARAATYTISPVEWGTPVLHLAVDDPRLFEVAAKALSAQDMAATHTDQADQFRLAGRYADAEASYAVALTLDPASASAHAGLAEALYELGRYAEAEPKCRGAIRLSPDDDPAREAQRRLLNEILRALGQASHPTAKEMELIGVRVEMPSNNPVTLLKENPGNRYLPIWTDAVEATAIAFAQQRMVSLRPLTHDLFCDVLEALDVRMLHGSINSLTDGIFRAEMALSNGVSLSARPSDLIALAVRTQAPLYAAAEVLDEAGVALPDEPNEQQAAGRPSDSQPAGSRAVPPPSPETSAMIELVVVGVRVEQPSNNPIILFREKSGDRYLPIWIGAVEATAVAFAQQGTADKRPQPYDLLHDVLKAVNIRLLNASIMVLLDGIFYVDLNFSNGSKVSSRPSDAATLTLLTGAPIYITEELLDQAAVAIPEEEERQA